MTSIVKVIVICRFVVIPNPGPEHHIQTVSEVQILYADKPWLKVTPKAKAPFDWRARLSRLFCPFVTSLRNYKVEILLRDVIAGLTVACIRLPQGLAYGALASIPPIHGLYTGTLSLILKHLLKKLFSISKITLFWPFWTLQLTELLIA